MEHAIRELVEQSYTNGILDDKKVNQISDKLSRRLLKEYIRFLKEYESKLHVYVSTAKEIDKQQKDIISKQFPHKTIVYRLDSDIISGIKIVDYDMVYEISLRQIFNDISNYLINYD